MYLATSQQSGLYFLYVKGLILTIREHTNQYWGSLSCICMHWTQQVPWVFVGDLEAELTRMELVPLEHPRRLQ